MKKTVLGFVLLAASLSAADFFPLAPGNRWEYRSREGQFLTITVSNQPVSTDRGIYYRVTGYAPLPQLIRQDVDGNLYRWNQETDRDEVLTKFNPGDRYNTSLAECVQSAIVDTKRVSVPNFRAELAQAVAIQYSGGCPDAALDQELYLENLGMVRRTVSWLIGPRVFELVSARVGNLNYLRDAAARAELSFPQTTFDRVEPSNTLRIPGTLRISVFGMGGPVRLPFNSSQRFDVVLKNQRGEQVYRWSSDKLFNPVVTEEFFEGERTYSFTIELPQGQAYNFITGELISVADGVYDVEAWLTTTGERRFAATGRIEIRSQVQPAQ